MITEEQSERFKRLLKTKDKLRIARKHSFSYAYIDNIISMIRFNADVVSDLIEECEKKEKNKKQIA